jgi:hypothetical protein
VRREKNDDGDGEAKTFPHTARSPSAFCLLLFVDGKRCVIADIITVDSASKENRLSIFHAEGSEKFLKIKLLMDGDD